MLGVKTPEHLSKLPPSMVLLMIQFTLRLVGSFRRYLQWELGKSKIIAWDSNIPKVKIPVKIL